MPRCDICWNIVTLFPMRIKRLLLVPILLLSIASMAQSGSERVNVRISGEDFESLARQIETQCGCAIYYRPEWFQEKLFSYEADSVSVDDVLSRVLMGTGLQYSRVGDHYYILPDQRLNMNLPVFSTSTQNYQEEQATGEYMGVKDDLYLTGTRPEKMARSIEVGERGASLARGVARIMGKLINISNGEPVMGATMVDLGSGK